MALRLHLVVLRRVQDLRSSVVEIIPSSIRATFCSIACAFVDVLDQLFLELNHVSSLLIVN